MKFFGIFFAAFFANQGLAATSAAIPNCSSHEFNASCILENETCEYRAVVAVMFLDHCGYRNEFIGFDLLKGSSACPDIKQFYNGFYLSIADWEADNPCQ